jgi:uncharacterized protein YgiM (DUF1202 family)
MKIFVTILMLLWYGVATAETANVVDSVRANMRSGQGENYRTLRILPAKTEVEIIEADGEYTKIKTAEGQSGWVKSSLLIPSQPPSAAESAAQAAPSEDLGAAKKELLAAREQLTKTQNDLEKERALTKGEPLHATLLWVALAAFAVGLISGAMLLRTYYNRRLHGLRI